MNPLGVHGLLLIDKPVAWTSHQVVARVRKLLGLRAVGHAGTLDPLASGLLVILVGEGTKISDYVLAGDKGYRAQILLGARTDTQDITGQVVERKPVAVSEEQLLQCLNDLTGQVELAVPAYSAVKVDGQKLYTYARAERPVECPRRLMDFRHVRLLSFETPVVEVEILCSKGSFVRAWAEELGRRLGCGATLKGLRRTWSNPYTLDEAITLDELSQILNENGSLDAIQDRAYIPLATTLPLFPEMRVEGRESELIRNGQIPNTMRGRLLGDLRHSSGRKILDAEGAKMLALIVSDASCNLRIRRVFHY